MVPKAHSCSPNIPLFLGYLMSSEVLLSVCFGLLFHIIQAFTKCLLTLGSLLICKRGTDVLTGSFYRWARRLNNGVTNQLPSKIGWFLLIGQSAFLEGFLQFPDWDISPLPPGLGKQNLVCWFNLLLWIRGVAWLSGIEREMWAGCCVTKKKERKFSQASCFSLTLHSCLQRA